MLVWGEMDEDGYLEAGLNIWLEILESKLALRLKIAHNKEIQTFVIGLKLEIINFNAKYSSLLEAELMDGRRGLVPSNYITKLVYFSI